MSDNNENDGGSPAKANLIRVVILVLLVAGLGGAMLRIKQQQEHNKKIMDITTPNVNIQNAGPSKKPNQADVMKAVIQGQAELKKQQKAEEAAAPAAPADAAPADAAAAPADAAAAPQQ